MYSILDEDYLHYHIIRQEGPCSEIRSFIINLLNQIVQSESSKIWRLILDTETTI